MKFKLIRYLHKAIFRKLDPVFSTFVATRPTAVNIQWAVDRLQCLLSARKDEPVSALKGLLIEESQKILAEDIEVNKGIGGWGAQFISDGDTILTHCNAGSLATGGYGTATAPMRDRARAGQEIPGHC